jgi:hypothetical protein
MVAGMRDKTSTSYINISHPGNALTTNKNTNKPITHSRNVFGRGALAPRYSQIIPFASCRLQHLRDDLCNFNNKNCLFGRRTRTQVGNTEKNGYWRQLRVKELGHQAPLPSFELFSSLKHSASVIPSPTVLYCL